MRVVVKKADPKTESAALTALDRKIFLESDWFREDAWMEFECYWLLVDNARVGSIVMELHCDAEKPPKYLKPCRGCLYILSTGILPEFQGRGLGTFLKAWQIKYAKKKGFQRIVTNARVSNKRIIDLNKKFGFRKTRMFSDYYHAPDEGTIVLELTL